MLGLLDLFTPEQPQLTAEQIAARLGASTATAYRYAAELCAAGLLARFSGGFTLGPRIVELDRTIREHDPLLLAGLPVLRQLRDRTGCDVLLAEMFGDRVVAVHHERGTDATTVSFGRGRPMPLFRGAGSKAILASLPLPQLRRLCARHGAAIAQAGLGTDWPGFRAAVAALRRAGHAISLGELDAQNVGIGAPVPRQAGVPPASLVAVLSRARWEITDKALAAKLVVQAADAIGAALHAVEDPGPQAPAAARKQRKGGGRE